VVQCYESVEDLLKCLKRPATGFEIVLALAMVKNRSSVYSEIRGLLADKSVRKESVSVRGFDGVVTLYVKKY